MLACPFCKSTAVVTAQLAVWWHRITKGQNLVCASCDRGWQGTSEELRQAQFAEGVNKKKDGVRA